jgi:cation diffusion facilitator family transporter
MKNNGAESGGQLRTAIASIVAATALVVLKLGSGLVTGSLGLVSAGIESSGDVVAAVLTFFAIRLGGRPADESHPFGHRRAENLAALGEASILTGGGIVVVVEAVHRLRSGGGALAARWYVFVVIGVALAVDFSRITLSLRTAARYSSAALRSNAFHFAGDLAGSVAVLVGLIAVAAGVRQGDVIAALVVAVIIFSAATRLIYENARVLMDTAPSDASQHARQAVEALGEDVQLRRLRLRESGGHYFADAVVAVPPGQAVVESHATADQIEDAIREALPDSDVVVHLEPQRENLDLRDRALAVALAEPLVREAHDITLYEHGGQISISLHLKMPADLPLSEAHAVAERVEAALATEPEVSSVQTHLEPIERPESAASANRGDGEEAARIRALVKRHTGREPLDLTLMHAARGRVVFLTIAVKPEIGLAEAHDLAGRLEEEIRRDQPRMADVVVHTEPLAATRGR